MKHQRTIGRSQVHLTPPWILKPLGRFDTDPCAADPRPWPIADRHITEAENSLNIDWRELGRVFMNCPFDRRVIGQFVSRMCGHGYGTALLHARTDTRWFQPVFDTATALFFLRGRVNFYRPDGTLVTKQNGEVKDSGAPVVLVAFGMFDADVLAGCGLAGKFIPLIVTLSILALAVSGTWRDELLTWMRARGGTVHTDEIYRAFANHPKTKSNKHWRDKLRQVLHEGPFVRVGGRQWSAA